MTFLRLSVRRMLERRGSGFPESVDKKSDAIAGEVVIRGSLGGKEYSS